MKFLEKPDKLKTIRTVLYDDQSFRRWELEILHTPIVQRLYDLKQLGFADRVFPDAVHSRFNHILGVCELTNRMTENLTRWLLANSKIEFQYIANEEQTDITGKALADRLKTKAGAARLVALLHDLTHSAFGHTLEDEVRVFSEKHDDPKRQAAFMDTLVAQLVVTWKGEIDALNPIGIDKLEAISNMEIDEGLILSCAKDIEKIAPNRAKKIEEYLQELEFASCALLHLEWAHGGDEIDPTIVDDLLVAKVRRVLNPSSVPTNFNPYLDLFIIDMIGNTICADLLDYAKRDATNAGLKLGFDTRLLKYVCVVSVKEPLAPVEGPCIRLATQFFTDKMRYDVLSEMSAILKARYLINERILFHPVKCALGATLGTSVQILGLTNPPLWVQCLGDQAFLALLARLACLLQTAADAIQKSEQTDLTEIAGMVAAGDDKIPPILGNLLEVISHESKFTERSDVMSRTKFAGELRIRSNATRRLLWKISARRRPELVYRNRLSAQSNHGETSTNIADRLADLGSRYRAERKVEDICNIPMGSVVIHCPPKRPGVKIANAIVVGSNLSESRRLRDVAGDRGDKYFRELEPYQKEMRDIEHMYSSIWQLHAFLDTDFRHKQNLVKAALAFILDVPNDELLANFEDSRRTNRYDVIADELCHAYGDDYFGAVVRKLDQEGAGLRMRFGDENKERDIAQKAIDAVVKGEFGPDQPTLPDSF